MQKLKNPCVLNSSTRPYNFKNWHLALLHGCRIDILQLFQSQGQDCQWLLCALSVCLMCQQLHHPKVDDGWLDIWSSICWCKFNHWLCVLWENTVCILPYYMSQYSATDHLPHLGVPPGGVLNRNLGRGVQPTQQNPDPVQDTKDVNFATLSKRKCCNLLPVQDWTK